MPTFTADATAIRSGTVRLTGGEAHHLARVLRFVAGDEITISDGKGGRFLAKITAVGKSVDATILKELAPLPPPHPIHLYLALIKGEALETIVEKSVELNIDAVHLIVTERSVIKDLSPAKFQRLGRIIEAAMKQSGRTQPLGLVTLQGMEAALREAGDRNHFIFLERKEARTLKTILATKKVPPPYGLWIGPEGGWADDEVRMAEATGCMRATLGPLILRSPTAVLHAISSIIALTT